MRHRCLPLTASLLALACSTSAPSDAPVGNTGGGGSASEDTGSPDDPLPVVDHCDDVEEDETWGPAGSLHHVTCNIDVKRGVLTIEAGVDVLFDAGTGLVVGQVDHGAGLVISGTADMPVRLHSLRDEDARGAWRGVRLHSNTTTAALTGVRMYNGGEGSRAGLYIDGPEVHLSDVEISRSPGCGLMLTGGGRLSSDSDALVLTESALSACVTIDVAHTLPANNSAYTGNDSDRIEVESSALETAATWTNLGVPYAVLDGMKLGGTATDPAILTLGAGTELQMGHDEAIRLSKDGGASGLISQGTPDERVLITGERSPERGAWRGIEIFNGALEGQLDLAHTTITAAGHGQDAALRVEDASILLQDVLISASASAGLGLEGAARIDDASHDITVVDCTEPIYMAPNSVGGFMVDGLSLTGNDDDHIRVTGDDFVTTSATWPDLGLTYRVDTDVYVEGTAEATTVLTLTAGTILRFASNKGLFVARSGGAAALRLDGTPEAPVQMLPWDANVPGAWAGVGIYHHAVDAETSLRHFEIGYAGGRSLDGGLHLSEASPTVQDGLLTSNEGYGLYIDHATPSLSDMQYDHNDLGPCNQDDCGAAE